MTTRTPEYASRVLIRSWNLFHGRTVPSGRRRYFERMVKLICEDGPASSRCRSSPPERSLDSKRGRATPAYGDVASPARLPRNLGWAHDRPRPDPAPLCGRGAGERDPRRARPRGDRPTGDRPQPARLPEAGRRGAGARLVVTRLRWARERRICQAVRIRLEDGRSAVVGNLHATSFRNEKRVADAELLRAAAFLDGVANPGEPVVLAGDFNVTVVTSPTRPRARHLGVGVLAGGARPRPRARPRPDAAGPRAALARRPPATRGRPPVGSCARGARGPMTFDEARAQFPVLERYAYLNAGTFGPMPTAVADAIAAEQQRALVEGQLQPRRVRQVPRGSASRTRAVRAADRRARREHRAHDVDLGGLQRRAERARPPRGRRGRHDRVGALRPDRTAGGEPRHRADRARPRPSCGGRVRDDPRRGRPEDEADRAVGGALDQRPSCFRGASCARRPASPCSSTARSRPARSPSTRRTPTSTPSRHRSGSAVPT